MADPFFLFCRTNSCVRILKDSLVAALEAQDRSVLREDARVDPVVVSVSDSAKIEICGYHGRKSLVESGV